MEENKTKKMTKAEAFEWLKGKKVACNDCNEILVQRKLFEAGIRWWSGDSDVIDGATFLFINPNGITHCSSMEWFDTHAYEEVSANDILSIEIVENTKPDYYKINEYVKALQELIAKSDCIDCIIISKNDFGILKK